MVVSIDRELELALRSPRMRIRLRKQACDADAVQLARERCMHLPIAGFQAEERIAGRVAHVRSMDHERARLPTHRGRDLRAVFESHTAVDIETALAGARRAADDKR